jgi:hypothetical protein
MEIVVILGDVAVYRCMIVNNAFEKKKSRWNLADYCNAPVYKEKKHTLSIQNIQTDDGLSCERLLTRPTTTHD